MAIPPAFVADCLETIVEIDIDYQELFVEHGEEKIQMIESLNDSDLLVKTIKNISLCQILLSYFYSVFAYIK